VLTCFLKSTDAQNNLVSQSVLGYVNLHFEFISERRQSAPLFQQLMLLADAMDAAPNQL
jgi:hypothetical protein